MLRQQNFSSVAHALQSGFCATRSRCRRRGRVLAPLALRIICARDDGRSLAPTAWVAFAALAAFIFQASAISEPMVPSIVLFLMLCLIALFDARYFVVPDGPLLVAAAAASATWPDGVAGDAAPRLAAAVAAFVCLRFVALAYERLRGYPGVGAGDARLFALAGLWLGVEGLPSCLLYAALSALVSAVVAMRQGALEHARAPLPFAPHLGLGLWLVWTVGPLELG